MYGSGEAISCASSCHQLVGVDGTVDVAVSIRASLGRDRETCHLAAMGTFSYVGNASCPIGVRESCSHVTSLPASQHCYSQFYQAQHQNGMLHFPALTIPAENLPEMVRIPLDAGAQRLSLPLDDDKGHGEIRVMGDRQVDVRATDAVEVFEHQTSQAE